MMESTMYNDVNNAPVYKLNAFITECLIFSFMVSKIHSQISRTQNTSCLKIGKEKKL